MTVIPPNNLDPNAAPWGRHITNLVESHEGVISRLANQTITQNKQLNSSVNSLISTTADIVANAYTADQAATDNAATLAAAQAYAAPVVHTHDAGDIVSGTLGRPISTTTGNFTGSITSIGAKNNQVTTGYVAAYIDVNGVFGFAPSAERFKQDITPYKGDPNAVLGMQVVNYRTKDAVAELGDSAPIETGVIAEQLEVLGLDWLVAHDADGNTQTVYYERMALALIPIIKQQAADIAALKAKLNI